MRITHTAYLMEKHIHQLLHLHECVVIPHFGAFVLRYYPAELQDGTLLFRPPSRRVCFQPGLTVSDGILTHYLARKMALSYRDAEAHIDNQVRKWNKQLRSGHSIGLSGIGKIYQMPGGGLEFFPELNTNFLRESFGLPIIRVNEKQQSKPIRRKDTAAAPLQQSVSKDEAAIFAPWLRRVAAVALPAALAFNMVSTSRSLVNYEAGMVNMEWTAKKDVVSSHIFKDVLETSTVDTDLAIAKEDVSATIPNDAVNALETTAPAAYIIVGAFSEPQNAEHYVEKLRKQGFINAQTAGKAGNLTRVAAAAFETTEDARRELAQVKENLDGGAWVFSVER